MTRTQAENGKKEIVYFQAGYDRDDEIDLLELWDILWGGRWFIAGFTILCTVLAVVISFNYMTPIYKASATLEPTSESKNVIFNYLKSNKLHRKLINKYDLLKHLYPSLWNEENQKWQVDDVKEIPTIQKALVEDEFPLKIKNKGGLINLDWEATDPDFASEMLGNTIKELQNYLNNEYISDARTQMEIYKQELEPLTKRFENVWDQFWEFDKLTIASMEVLNQYTKIKDRISTLNVEDVLSRKFNVLDDPIPPQEHSEPNEKVIIASAFVVGFFLSIILVFFYRFLQIAETKKKT